MMMMMMIVPIRNGTAQTFLCSNTVYGEGSDMRLWSAHTATIPPACWMFA